MKRHHRPYPHNLPLEMYELPSLLKSIYELTSEPMVITNLVGKVISINPSFTKVFGYELEEVIGDTTVFMHMGEENAQDAHKKFMKDLHQDGYWHGLVWGRRKHGPVIVLDTKFAAVYDAKGYVTHYIGIYATMEQYGEKLKTHAHNIHKDSLTELPNIRLFMDRVGHAIKKVQRDCSVLSILYINLDHARLINQKYGFQTGDLFLRQISDELRKTFRDSDTIARVGGDEFAILGLDLYEEKDIEIVLKRMKHNLENVKLLGKKVEVSMSIGIARFPISGETEQEIYNAALMACKAAKDKGGNRHFFARPEKEEQIKKATAA